MRPRRVIDSIGVGLLLAVTLAGCTASASVTRTVTTDAGGDYHVEVQVDDEPAP